MARLVTARFDRLVPLALPFALALGLVGGGCVTASRSYETAARAQAADERMLVRTGSLTVSVGAPEEAAATVRALVADAGGLVERSTVSAERGVDLRCRVPAERLDATMEAIAALGSVVRRSVTEVDVTEEAMDTGTRLRNDEALRDRLRALLEQATDVEDVLAVERELTRLQSAIESAQARLDRLHHDVELSVLSVDLQQERRLGPLGYVGYGLWWLVRKLFVLD